MRPRRHFIAQVPFDFLNRSEVLRVVSVQPRTRPLMISLVNPHTVMTCYRREDVRQAVMASDLILPDGVGVTLAARLLCIRPCGRLPGPGLVRYLCDEGRSSGLRHYFYGGGPGSAAKMATSLSTHFAGVNVCGWDCPPYFETPRTGEADDCRKISQAVPDIVWVGLGAPKQELWMARNIGRLRARAVIGVGAAFDFESGNVRRAPAWIQQWGLEWLYRFSQEPRRLWRRNLDSPRFLLKACWHRHSCQPTGKKAYPLAEKFPAGS